MMPLWMMAKLPVNEMCGWALVELGSPCVAQRVWAIPTVPVVSLSDAKDSKSATFPLVL